MESEMRKKKNLEEATRKLGHDLRNSIKYIKQGFN